MSAYVVSSKTINRIVTAIFNPNIIREEELRDSLLGFGLFNIQDQKGLATELFNLNVEAVKYRYPDDDEIYSYGAFCKDFCSLIQAIKSSHCLRYNCYEGDNDKKPIFKFLDWAIQEMEQSFIRGLDEYDKAQWG